MASRKFKANISKDLKEHWLNWCAADENATVDQVKKWYNDDGKLDILHEKFSGKHGVEVFKDGNDYFFVEDNNFRVPEHLFERV